MACSLQSNLPIDDSCLLYTVRLCNAPLTGQFLQTWRFQRLNIFVFFSPLYVLFNVQLHLAMPIVEQHCRRNYFPAALLVYVMSWFSCHTLKTGTVVGCNLSWRFYMAIFFSVWNHEGLDFNSYKRCLVVRGMCMRMRVHPTSSPNQLRNT